MSIRWTFHPISEFAELEAIWDRINGRAGRLPFLESRFLLPLAKHFSRGHELVALGFVHDEPVAAALLAKQGLLQWATFQPSQLPLGPWIVSSSEDGEALARSLIVELPGLVVALGLTQLDPRLYSRALDRATFQSLDYLPTAWVDVEGSFDAYWEARGKNLRTNMRKQRAKLQADGVGVRFETLTDVADVAAAISEYGRLESAGWKAESGTAVHPDNPQGRFYTEMMQRFCADGRGRIWQLRFDDRIVAMDLCIESSDTLVVLKTAFDPEFRSVSPAFLLRQDAFRQVFDEARIKRIEFYGRLMEWHTRWTERSRMLYHANVYRWAFIPPLRNALRRGTGKPSDDAASHRDTAVEGV